MKGKWEDEGGGSKERGGGDEQRPDFYAATNVKICNEIAQYAIIFYVMLMYYEKMSLHKNK